MRWRTIVRMIAGLVAAMAAGVAVQAAPAPGGHDLILRGLIRDATQGEIRYETMTPELATLVRPQAAVAKSELTALGPLKSVTFQSLNPAGSEIYRAVFEHGVLEWAFSVNARGLIENAIYRPAPADPS